jgi:transposase-like protein
MGKKSEVPVDQRRDAVLSLLRREEVAAVIARRYGVSENTLYRWRDEFITAGESGLSGKGNGKGPDAKLVKELRRELAERDQVIGELTIANRILKKLSAGPR